MNTQAVSVLEALQAFDRSALRAALRKGASVPALWSPGLPLISGFVRAGLDRFGREASSLEVDAHFEARLASMVDLLLVHSPSLELNATYTPVGTSSMKVTPLLAAAQEKSVLLVEVLARHGANVNALTALGACAAHWAAARGNVRMLRRLAEHQANLDQADDDGRTPAHWAAREGQVLILRELKRLGAECTQPDLKKETPADRLAWLEDGRAHQSAWLTWLGLHTAKARAKALSSMLPEQEEGASDSKPPKTRF